MENAYHVGNCPLCQGYGRMEVNYNFKSGNCYIECEECFLQFDTLNDFIENKNGYREFLKPNEKPTVRLATIEEITNTEWYPYLMESD
jgi:hypothetical protein